MRGAEVPPDAAVASDSSNDSSSDSTAPGDSLAQDSSNHETAETITCPPPGVGELHVSPTGSDGSGNGSSACPFKTVSKAISATVGSSAFTTIALHKTAITPTIYGSTSSVDCTGGAPCDPSPIVVPATVTSGLVIRGEGAAEDISLIGEGAAVLQISARSVGVAHLTLTPSRFAASGAGTHGIVIDAPAAVAVAEQAITDVNIAGTHSVATSGSGYGIWFKPGSSAGTILGPAVRVDGGYISIRLENSSSKIRITGDPSAETVIGGALYGCLSVTGGTSDRSSVAIDSGTATSSHVTFDTCGVSGSPSLAFDMQGGTTSSIDRATISKGWGGLRLRGNPKMNVSNLTISNGLGTGIDASDSSMLTLKSASVVGAEVGVILNLSASATIDGLSVSQSKFDGLQCEGNATMVVRNSSFLANGGSGMYVTDSCSADLGSAAVPGNNVFNVTSQRNTKAGLCFKPTSSVTFPIAQKSTWSCGYTATGCTTTGYTPTRSTSGVLCATGVDISQPGGTTALAAPSPSCCSK